MSGREDGAVPNKATALIKASQAFESQRRESFPSGDSLFTSWKGIIISTSVATREQIY